MDCVCTSLTCKTSTGPMHPVLPSPADDLALSSDQQQQRVNMPCSRAEHKGWLQAWETQQQQLQLPSLSQLQLGSVADTGGTAQHGSKLMHIGSVDASSSKSGDGSAHSGSNDSVTGDGQGPDGEVAQPAPRGPRRSRQPLKSGRKGRGPQHRKSADSGRAVGAQAMQQDDVQQETAGATGQGLVPATSACRSRQEPRAQGPALDDPQQPGLGSLGEAAAACG